MSYNEKEFDAMWNRLVPMAGKAETLRGEVLRCAGRIEYECYNNGNGNVESSVHDYYHEMLGFLRSQGLSVNRIQHEYDMGYGVEHDYSAYAKLVQEAMDFVKREEAERIAQGLDV